MPNHVDDTMVTLANQHQELVRRLELLERRQRESLGDFERRLEHRLEVLDSAQWEQATMTREAVAAAVRNTTVDQLVSELGKVAARRPGLSVLTITWNHAEYLKEALSSGAQALELLAPDQQGELLVLDDCSSDRTAAVLDAFGSSDARVRTLRAPINLGLSRARNVLLHACQTSHALMLDADNVAIPHGVHALYEAARATAATFTYGNILQFDQRGSQFVLSNEPIVPTFPHSNYIDTLAVIDVDRIAALGGYTLAPLLYALDDYELIHRLVDADELLAFVPTVVGRYRLLDVSHSRGIRDARPGYQHLARAHRAGSESIVSRARVVVTHRVAGRSGRVPR